MSSSTIRSATSAAVNRLEAFAKPESGVGRTRPSKPTGWPVVREMFGW
jgi:hypothetical protein